MIPHPRDVWNFNDPAESEARFRDLLNQASEEEDVYILKTQIARTLGMRRRFDEAQAVLGEVPEATTARSRWETYALLERGRVLNSSKRPAEARPLFDLAATSPFDDLRIDAIHMQAIVAEPDVALKLNEKAIAEAKASEDPFAQLWLGSLLNNTGWTYHSLGNFGRALELFEDALAFRESRGDATTIKIAKWCVGRCLRSLGRTEEALAKQQELDPEDGYVSEELGECLLELGRIEESKPHFAKAYELLSQDAWLTENEPERLARLKELSA